MDITIINGRYGEVIAHRTGCRDIAKDALHCETFNETTTSKREAFLDYNADFIGEADGDESNAYPIEWKPCTDDLPDE